MTSVKFSDAIESSASFDGKCNRKVKKGHFCPPPGFSSPRKSRLPGSCFFVSSSSVAHRRLASLDQCRSIEILTKSKQLPAASQLPSRTVRPPNTAKSRPRKHAKQKTQNSRNETRARGGDGAGAGGASDRLRMRILLEQIHRAALGGPALHLLRRGHCFGPAALRSVCRRLRGATGVVFRRAFFSFVVLVAHFFSFFVPLCLMRAKALQSRQRLARAAAACSMTPQNAPIGASREKRKEKETADFAFRAHFPYLCSAVGIGTDAIAGGDQMDGRLV